MHSPSPLDQNLFIKKKRRQNYWLHSTILPGSTKWQKIHAQRSILLNGNDRHDYNKSQPCLQHIFEFISTQIQFWLHSQKKKKKKKSTQIQHYSLASFSFTQRSKYRVCNQNRIKQYNTYLKPRKKISSYKNQSSKSSIILFKYNCYLLNMGQGVCSFLRTETQCLINGWGGTNTWK